MENNSETGDSKNGKVKDILSGGVAFNANDSEVTFNSNDGEKTNVSNLPSILSSPLTSLRSFTQRSLSRDYSRSISDNSSEGGSEMKNASTVVAIERRNLLNLVKLSVNVLIESSSASGHSLDSDDSVLQQFFVIIENVLQHRLKGAKRFFGQNRYFWPTLEAIERFHPAAPSIMKSVRSLPGIKTYLGKCRAWLRLALMQKKLAEYIQVIVEHKSVFSEWFEDDSMLMSDDGAILLAHLAGLTCIDANLCVKDDDLDGQPTTIDYSLYVKDAEARMSQSENADVESAMQKLLNQKTYLEERNRHLETNLNELRKKAGTFELTNQKQADEIAVCQEKIRSLQVANDELLAAQINMADAHARAMREREDAAEKERRSLVRTLAELNAQLERSKQQLKQEISTRLEAEKEIEQQVSNQQELEIAFNNQGTDLAQKQEGLVALRAQLDDVKTKNAELQRMLQTQGAELSSVDQSSCEDDVIASLTKQLKEAQEEAGSAAGEVGRLNNQLEDSKESRNALSSNLQAEREWREALQQEKEAQEQEIILLKEKLEMMEPLKEEVVTVTRDRDRLKEALRGSISGEDK